MTGSVEEDLVLVDHLTGVLGGVLEAGRQLIWRERKGGRGGGRGEGNKINMASATHIHGLLAGGDLAGVPLGQGPVEGVGEGVLAQVGEELLVDLEGGEVGGVGDGLLRKGLDDGGLVAGGVDELVVDDLDVGVVALELQDLVGDGLGVGEGGDVLAGAVEGEDDVAGVGPAQLGARLLADEDEVGGLVAGPDLAAHVARQAGVDAAAEALVGAADDVERLLALGVERLRLGALEHLAVGLPVLPGRLHGPLGARQLGRGDHLHRVGDLLDVPDGLEPALDLSQGRVGGSIAVGGGDGPVRVGG